MSRQNSSAEGVVTIAADAPIDEAIRLLEEHGIRHLPVVRSRQPVGMVSVGDVLQGVGGLLSRLRVSRHDPTVSHAGPTIVEEIMSREVVAVSPDDPPVVAARVMLQKQIAAVLLVADEELRGIVTETDFLRRFFQDREGAPEDCRQRPVAECMAEEVVAADPSQSVLDLMREMRQFHHLPVVADGELVGIITETDIIAVCVEVLDN